MSSKKISKDDALLIENGVLFSRATGMTYLCGDKTAAYEAYMKLQVVNQQNDFWKMYRKLFSLEDKAGCGMRLCDFVKITNIYNNPFLYIKEKRGHVSIIPFNKEVVILEDEMSDYFKEFFEKRDIYYDD